MLRKGKRKEKESQKAMAKWDGEVGSREQALFQGLLNVWVGKNLGSLCMPLS
jgi:hypothetical protein